MSAQSLPSPVSASRPPVAKHPNAITKRPKMLKRQSSTRNLYKTAEKAANHDAMMKKFNLRKMSDSLGLPSKFGRASEVVIDKAIGTPYQQNRRFSLHRSIRSMTSVKARRSMFRALTSPITPRSWPSTAHGILMLFAYHFQWLYLPFFASYYPTGSQGTATIVMILETCFLTDLLLNFNTAYVDQGNLITSRRQIALRYIRSWFALDLVLAMPIQICFYIVTGHFTHDAVRGVQIALMVLRLFRMTLERGVLLNRVMRVANHFTEWLRYSRYSHLLGIAKLMWLVLLIAHYMACFWHVVSCIEGIQTRSVGEQYAADYYYAVSLIQGQGNAGGTYEENLFSSVAIIVGSVILAIVFGNVAMLVSNFNANETNYHRKMEAVYETMEKMDLPLRLRERVNEYYKHAWVEYEALDGNINKFQQELTHTLGIEIGLYKHMNLVVMVPFWKDCTPDFLTQIVLNLDVRVYMPDDYVVRRRETSSEMMMINRGYCKLTKPSAYAYEEDANADDQAVGREIYELSEDEDDCSDEINSDDDGLEIFGGGMFGASISRFTGDTNGQASDFTDVRRFRTAHGRRPSYPEGTEARKSRKYRQYLHPGQAFGEMSLLMNYKRTANIRAVTFVEMCVLSRQDFQNIISRYPEDRRRVLTAMLESCIEKNVIPFPWESILQVVSEKRRQSGKKNSFRASAIATMSAPDVARILVDAIDINVPDESIKYGFQNFDQVFVEDSSLGYADSMDGETSDTHLRQGSSLQSGGGYSSHTSRTESTDDAASTSDLGSEPSSTAPNDGQSSHSVLLLLQSMAKNIEKLQHDVEVLRDRDCGRCSNCGSGRPKVRTGQRVAPASMLDQRHVNVSANSRVASMHAPITKEDDQAQAPRKPSFVAPRRGSISLASSQTRSTRDNKAPITILRRNRSTTQDPDGMNHSTHSKREKASVRSVKSPRTEVVPISTTADPRPQMEIDRYPVSLSSRSRAAQHQTLADLLWKRSNTSGDMLKHTELERNAARLRRQMRSRRSLPSEVFPKHEDEGLDPAATWIQTPVIS